MYRDVTDTRCVWWVIAAAVLCSPQVATEDLPPDVNYGIPYISVNESAPVGTVLKTFTAENHNTHTPVNVTTTGQNTDNYVYLRQGAGTGWEIVLKTTLDYEAVKRTTLSFRAEGQLPLEFTIQMYIRDVNDVHPQFKDVPYNARVNESAPDGTIVFTGIKSEDPDDGQGGVVTYSLVLAMQSSSGVADVFSIDQHSGVVTLNGALDYETTTIYHYFVVATDNGYNHLSSSTDLYITVLDVQDSPPYFTNPPYIGSVNESSATETVVLTVKALDGDRAVSNRVVYNITSPDCQGLFQISDTSGEISVASRLDRDRPPLSTRNGLCTATVEATELDDHPPQLGQFTASQQVTITVNDVNDNRPRFSGTSFSAGIDENSPAGTALVLENGNQISVSDADQGINSEITLALHDTTNTFELMSTKVQSSGLVSIRVKNSSSLDFETIETINFTINARDHVGSDRVSGTASVTVRINNINEFSPNFTQSRFTKRIPEGSARGISVTTITAIDHDSGDYGRITYTLQNARNTFAIDQSSGVVTTTTNQTDRERMDTYNMLVLATDGGGRMQTVPLIITIDDVNDNRPEFTQDQYDAVLNEGDTTFNRPLTLQATDGDAPGSPNSNVSFRMVSSSPAGLLRNFYLDSINGHLTVKTALDYDTLNFQGTVRLVVEARDHGTTPLSSTATVEIVLNDVNDNSPAFSMSSHSKQIREGTPIGTSVLEVTATDADGSAPNNALLYSLESGGQDKFRINSTTGVITVSGPLDRETVSSYTLNIVVRDKAPNPLSNTTQVHISILDVNDEPPTFGGKKNEERSVDELTIGPLYSMTATDPDQNVRLRYSILWRNSTGEDGSYQPVSDVQDWITIDPNSGQLSARKALNRTAVSKFVLYVQVNDTLAESNLPQVDTAVITLNIVDINDNAPTFSETRGVEATVRENMGPGTAVTFTNPLRVFDNDVGSNSEFSLAVAGPNRDYFEVLPSTVQNSADVILRVRNNSILDYETNQRVLVQINALETRTAAPHHNIVQVTVFIEDENDHSPQFQNATYDVTISEASPAGLRITTVHATDADGSSRYNKVTYSLQGADGRFHIDPDSGEVTLTTSHLDYDTQPNTYQLTVLASDPGNQRDDAQLVIRLSDVNDETPQFSRDYSATLQENKTTFEVSLVVHATDNDGPGTPNSNVTYSIVSATPTQLRSNFQIPNPYSGEVEVVTPVDFETLRPPTIHLTLKAADGGNPQLTSTGSVVITVDDINDHSPEFSSHHLSTSVAENVAIGTRVFDFNATDGDGSSPNKDIFYLIKSGANDQFEVDASTGQLKTSSSLDRERTASYTVVVLAIDKGVPPRTGTATLTITVNDINDVAPTFPIPEVALTKEEGITGEVYTFNATDPDLNADLRYSINWTMSRGFRPAEEPITPETLRRAFRIDNSSGLITVNRELDREQLESAKLVVMVQDLHEHTPGQTATGTVSITVQDIDDNPPVFSVTHVQASVEENWPNGMPISLPEITVTDKDKDRNSQFRLRLSDGMDRTFHVVPDTARGSTVVGLRVKNNTLLDYETRTSLSFRVIAEGTVNTSLHGECTVNLNITNVNDFTPVFQTSLYNKTVPEDIIIGTSLLTVKATDGDAGKFGQLSYSIIGGSPMFSINADNGTISAASSPFDRETTPDYILMVMATDGGRASTTTRVHVTLSDVNDLAPEFSLRDYSAVLEENSQDFKAGVTVKAIDGDQAGTDNARITYSLAASHWSRNFRVNHTTGLLSVHSPLDYENSGPSVVLIVRATDHGTPQKTGSANITVTVQDVNDETPVFTASVYHGNVTENGDIGENITTVNANDADGSIPNNDIFYVITKGSDDKFTINSKTGLISTVSSLDREQKAAYNLEVLAVDKGSPARTASVTVSVDVLNVNDDDPTFPSRVVSVVATEEQAPGSRVCNFSAVDGDMDSRLKYTVVWNQCHGYDENQTEVPTATLQSAFRIDSSSGLITVNRRLDREKLESANLIVVVQDLHAVTSGQTATGTVSITVQDIDDNPPVFSVSHMQASVEENWPHGMPISLPEITVTDKDKDRNSQFRLRLSDGMDRTFHVVPDTARGSTVVGLRVKNNTLLDYETRTSLSFRVIAEGAVNTSLHGECIVNLNITNVNDFTPSFQKSLYNKTVPEDIIIGTSVLTVKATDGDAGKFGLLRYSIIGDSPMFSISTENGTISAASSLFDRETTPEYILMVSATDGGEVSATTRVHVTLSDVNDLAPVFARGDYSAVLKENSKLFEVGLTVKAQDGDQAGTDNARITYSLAHNEWSRHFTMNATTGLLSVNSSLDYETSGPSVILTVKATDHGTRPMTGSANITVTVQDENDETPVFTNRTFYADVWENSVHDTYVVTLHATDDDASSPNNVVFFGLESGGADNFRVNSTSGVVTVGPGAVLDRETDAGFNLIVLALDRGDPPRSSNATVSISLLDVNDKPPSFVSARKEVSIYENSSVSTSVWQMTAEDKDTDPLLVYSLLLNDSQAATDRDASVSMEVVWNWFTINPSDGTVSVNGVLDREKAEVVILKIMVNDTNGESPQTDDATLTITLLDVNDNSPDIAGNRNLRVSEALAVGTEVTSLTATDLDRDQTVTFHMLDAVSNFTISEDGKISLLHALDRETQPSLNFTVMATDSGTPPMSTNMTITVEVTDANDNDPEFNNDHYSFNVSEHADNQTVVATMTAIDRDEGDNALVTFDFGENVNDFSIDQTTGEISVKRKLDRETIPSYTIGVVAIDNPRTEERRRTAKQITITVTDYNDNPPTFDNIDPSKDSYEGIITELAAIGERLTNINPGAIECSDLDTGENKELSFELLSLDNVTLFSMDEGTGFVYVNASLVGYGFETYNYTVTVTDHGVPSLSSTANLTIRVLDNNINRPQFVDNFSEPIIIPECFPVNTRITTLTADDADRDKTTNGLVEYRLEDGVSGSGDSTFFTINPNSGDLSLARHLNREEQWEFALMITASDHGEPQLSSTVNVIILVNDTNDNSPTFNVTHFFFSVAENDVNVVVGTVLAEDPDENKRTCYALAGESSDFFKIDANDAQEGVITLIKPLDRETIGQERISLTVTATDCTPFANLCGPDREGQKIEQSVATVDITVTDVNDNPPTFISPRLTKGFIATADYRHLIVNLQEYVSDNDTAPNRVHGFYSVSPPERDEGLEANDAVKQLDKPLELTTNGTVRTNAKFPADSQGFFTWHVMANDTGGTGNVTLRIYVVGEEKLIRITFFHSEEELRKTQDQVMKDLQDMTGLEFVADDLQEVLDSSGKPDPTRSALMVHAVDDKGEFKDADELQNFLDHQIEVTRHLKAQYQLLTIETAKAAKATEEDTIKTEIILVALIVLLIIAFLVTVLVMFLNIQRFKTKLRAATLETHAMQPGTLDGKIPGLKKFDSNPIFERDDLEQETRLDQDRFSNASCDSIDDNQVGNRVRRQDDDEQEVTLDLYGEDNEAYTGSRKNTLDLILDEHDRSKGLPNGHHSNGVAKVHKAAQESVMLQNVDVDLDELQTTDI